MRRHDGEEPDKGDIVLHRVPLGVLVNRVVAGVAGQAAEAAGR